MLATNGLILSLSTRNNNVANNDGFAKHAIGSFYDEAACLGLGFAKSQKPAFVQQHHHTAEATKRPEKTKEERME